MDFERVKNIKAGTYTGAIVGILLLLAFMVSWTTPVPDTPVLDEGIEVNLGNSETGLGDEAPMIPGPPAETDLETNAPPKSQLTEASEPTKEVETNDDDKEAPPAVVAKPVNPKPAAKKVPEKDITEKVKKPNTAIVNNPTPAPKKPIAVYKGGTAKGTGGNDADSWNNSRNQGIAGGTGDQGKPNGNPDSDNYTGNGGTGKSGVSISRGLQGRRISRLPSFEDDFNQNAKIAVDVKVSANGSVISATYQPRGSSTSDAGMRAIALQKARQLKFTEGQNGEESLGTIIFNFRLKN